MRSVLMRSVLILQPILQHRVQLLDHPGGVDRARESQTTDEPRPALSAADALLVGMHPQAAPRQASSWVEDDHVLAALFGRNHPQQV